MSPTLGFTGEYQSVGLDSDLDIDQLRLGAGLLTEAGVGLFAEYASIDFGGSDADGFAVHARLDGNPGGQALNLYGQIGYVWLNDDFEDISGLEFSVGAAYKFAPQVSGFIDYRQTSIEGDDSDVEFEFSDVRTGVRYHF